MLTQRMLTCLAAVAVCALGWLQPAFGEEPPAEDTPEGWVKAIPVPADPELEQQIVEVQDALKTINEQIVRRKRAVDEAKDASGKATLYEELERLRRERSVLQRLLDELVEEAKLSEQTAIDEALARARWLEQQRERHEKKEELIRDRQE